MCVFDSIHLSVSPFAALYCLPSCLPSFLLTINPPWELPTVEKGPYPYQTAKMTHPPTPLPPPSSLKPPPPPLPFIPPPLHRLLRHRHRSWQILASAPSHSTALAPLLSLQLPPSRPPSFIAMLVVTLPKHNGSSPKSSSDGNL